jgi:hypothetical protein
VTKSSGYTVAFAFALPIAPENAWTRGGSVLVIAGVRTLRYIGAFEHVILRGISSVFLPSRPHGRYAITTSSEVISSSGSFSKSDVTDRIDVSSLAGSVEQPGPSVPL